MATKTFNLQGFDELNKMLTEAGRLDDKVYAPLHRAFNTATKQLEAQAKENITANNSIASGQLRAGINSDVTIKPAEIVGIVSAQAQGANGYNYAPAVEYGTKPHWMPIAPLEEWVKLKHIGGGNAAQSRRIARAIQVSIARKGTKARPYMEPAFDDKKQDIARLIEKGFAQVVENFGR